MKVYHVKHARKAIPSRDIAKGDSYYWWKFRRGGKLISKTPPKRSQLTQSEFLAAVYDAEDSMQTMKDELAQAIEAVRGVSEQLEALSGEMESLGGEQEDKRSNMEERFPNGCPTMELLQSRSDWCEQVAEELRTAAQTVEDQMSDIESAIDPASTALDEVNWEVE